MKKLHIKFFALLFISICLFNNFKIINVFATPTFEAEGVVLMDGNSGQILFSKNPHVQYEPASITKVMTAIIVLENTNLSDKVTIGENPPFVDGSALGITEGEVYSIEELLLALLLSSANDCAEALAEHVAGSNAEFGKLMTEKAKELGAFNTTFKNPSGLPEDGHLTTAYDMALIMNYAASNDDFVRISQINAHHFTEHPFSDDSEKWAINGNNPLFDWSIYHYENLFTGKTGWTSNANHTYISAAKKNDILLIGTFLNSLNKDTHFRDVPKLFDFGFENFTTDLIIESGDVLGEIKIDDKTTIPLISNSNVYYTFSSNTSADLDVKLDYIEKDLSEVSISEGDFLFEGILSINGVEHATVDLLSGIDRPITRLSKITSTSYSFLLTLLKIIIIIALVLAIIIIILIIRRNYLRKMRRKKFPKYFSENFRKY